MGEATVDLMIHHHYSSSYAPITAPSPTILKMGVPQVANISQLVAYFFWVLSVADL